MIRAIIFDCFGVLYVDVSQAYFSQFPKLHEELTDINKQSDHGFLDRQTYIAAVAKITGLSKAETMRAFTKEHVLNQPLVGYIEHTLKPAYKIGLLSNIGREWIKDFFDANQLHTLFDSVVLSGEEGITKPNVLIFERAAEKLGVLPDQCLFIDDRQDNCEGARLAGMQSLLFESNRQIENDIATFINK